MSIVIGIAALLGLAGLAGLAWGHRMRQAKLMGKPRIRERLERAELLLLDGSNQEANETLQSIDAAVARLRGPDGAALRVRQRVLMADLLLNVGRRDVARGYAEEARLRLEGVT